MKKENSRPVETFTDLVNAFRSESTGKNSVSKAEIFDLMEKGGIESPGGIFIFANGLEAFFEAFPEAEPTMERSEDGKTIWTGYCLETLF